MEKQLSNSQIYILMMLNQQKNELQKQFQEIINIENEQIKMIAKYFDFPKEKEYSIRQNEDKIFIYFDEEDKKVIEKEE